MENIELTHLEKFKLVCVLDEEFTDKDIMILMKDVVIESEEEVQEFCAILKKHRPAVYDYLFSELLARSKLYCNKRKEEEWEQRISFAYGNLKLHAPNITKDFVRKVAEELRKGGV